MAKSTMVAAGDETAGLDILYKVGYDQLSAMRYDSIAEVNVPDSSLELAFDDVVLEDVEANWADIMADLDEDSRADGEEGVKSDPAPPIAFMQFEERAGMNAEDEHDDPNAY